MRIAQSALIAVVSAVSFGGEANPKQDARADQLAQQMGSDNEGTAHDAAIELASLGDARALPRIREILKYGSFDRKLRAVSGAACIPDPSVPDILLALLRDGQEEKLQRRVIDVFRKHAFAARPPLAAALLEKVLTMGERYDAVAEDAVLVAAEAGGVTGLQLAKLLDDMKLSSDRAERWGQTIVRAVTLTDKAHVVGPLTGLAMRDASALPAIGELRHMAICGDEAAYEALVILTRYDRPEIAAEAKQAVVAASTRHREDGAAKRRREWAEELAQLVTSEDPGRAFNAGITLLALGDVRALVGLRRGFENSTYDTKYWILKDMVKITDPRAADFLEWVIAKDEGRAIRMAAVGALTRYADEPKVSRFLREFAKTHPEQAGFVQRATEEGRRPPKDRAARKASEEFSEEACYYPGWSVSSATLSRVLFHFEDPKMGGKRLDEVLGGRDGDMLVAAVKQLSRSDDETVREAARGVLEYIRSKRKTGWVPIAGAAAGVLAVLGLGVLLLRAKRARARKASGAILVGSGK